MTKLKQGKYLMSDNFKLIRLTNIIGRPYYVSTSLRKEIDKNFGITTPNDEPSNTNSQT